MRPVAPLNSGPLGLLCVDKETFSQWYMFLRSGASFEKPKTNDGLKETFCSDCTREYQREMKKQRRCTKGTPAAIVRREVA